MVRTVISLDAEQKAWLDRKARESGKPMTALVREAVALYRVKNNQFEKPSVTTLLKRTQGIWQKGDGLKWQKKLREEWDDR